MKYFALLAVLVLALACGSKSVAPPAEFGGAAGTFSTNAGSGGRSFGNGGSSGSGGATGGEAGSADENPLAPIVTITSPVAVSDPNAGNVIVAPSVTVTCLVKRSTASGSTTVDPSSVEIARFDATGKQVDAFPGKATGNLDEYSAVFSPSEVDAPNGAISFKCTASDIASPPNTGSATVNTFIDHGPTITIVSPLADSPHALTQALAVQFSVAASPLSNSDQGAAVASVELDINGVKIDELAANETSPGQYQLSIDLTANRFKPTPTGATSIAIIATDVRQPAATSEDDYHIVIDGTGPVITVVSPVQNTIVGGKVVLEFTVVDADSGTDPNTVAVTLTGEAADNYPGGNWAPVRGTATNYTFDYTFDTRQLSSKTDVSVDIVATDLVGNLSQQGESTRYYIDNVRPSVDLQPPNLIERKSVTATVNDCSVAFDPLGRSPNDLDIIPDTNLFRALVWDEADVATGQQYPVFSGIDDSTVSLYVQSDPTAGLVKNVEGTPGGECDGVVAASPTLKFVRFDPVPPAGFALYSPAAPTVPQCSKGTDDPATKATLCNGQSDLEEVIMHELATTTPEVPVIYSDASTGAQCTGSEFNIADLVSADGWLCIAVVATDKTGNPAVSAPIRVCLDSTKYAGTPGCASNPAQNPPPTCIADTCVPQPHFRADEAQPIIDLP
jgi:hypothetical protein